MSVQQRAEETRTRLLTAAADCFAQYGYDAASVAEVCRRAGLSKGAFYHHFSSKHALFLELLDFWLAGIDLQLQQARVEASSVPDAIVAMVREAGPIFNMSDQYIPIFLEFYSMASRDPVVWQATVKPYRRYRDFFAQLAEAGIADGSLRPVHPLMAAQVLMSLAIGLLLQGMLNPDAEDWAAVAQEGVRMLLEGIRAG